MADWQVFFEKDIDKRDFLGYLTFVFSFVTNSLVMGVAESLYKAMSHEMVDFWHLCCDKLGFIG